MKRHWLLGLLLLSAISHAKEAPLAVAEADLALQKVYVHLKEVLGLGQSKFVVSSVKTPITRDLLVSRLAGLCAYIKPKIRAKALPKSNVKGLVPGLSIARQKELSLLTSYGLVASSSVVIKSAQTQYSPHEFGVVLGEFLARAMDITHQLDPKYSPELMPD